MVSLDEPLDLKVQSERTESSIILGKRAYLSPICAPLATTRIRVQCSTFPSPPPSPESHERQTSCLTPPAMDLSLSPSSRHTSSLSPSSSSFPSLSSPLESPHSSRSPQPHLFSPEAGYHRNREGGASSQGFPFYLPTKSSPRRYSFPSPKILSQHREKPGCHDPPSEGQLTCRWIKCHLLFHSLQDLVDHINDSHVKPEKDCGYCCQWEGCARNGRGFNARYKMLIHIRTHTNEKPHHCPTCSKSFSRLENLKIHTRSHTGEKPYICPYEGCNKRYSNSSDRFKHTRTHYVDKPYYCKKAGCLKRYTDPSSLRKHIKAHGHYVAQDQNSSNRSASELGLSAHQITPETPPGEQTRVIIPRAAASLLGGIGTSLPLSAFCQSTAFGQHGAPLFSMGTGARNGFVPLCLRDFPLLHFGLSASMLGLEGLGRLEHVFRKMPDDKEDEEVLNLSAGVSSGQSNHVSWAVSLQTALLLKPAVVS